MSALLTRVPRLLSTAWARSLSNIHFNATDGDVEELIEQSLVRGVANLARTQEHLERRVAMHECAWAQDKTTYRKKDEPDQERARILTTRREALSL